MLLSVQELVEKAWAFGSTHTLIFMIPEASSITCMLRWNPTTSLPSQISQPPANSLLCTTTLQPPLDLPGDVGLVLEAFGEANLNGLMPLSGAANPNTLTPQSGNTRRISVLTEAPLVTVKPSSAWDRSELLPLTQQIAGFYCSLSWSINWG